ncbi:MAG: transcriptional repressor [Bacteroidales bacterium]|nr:transcriptional repressor [Bacteroidales bacterium]
MTEEETLQHAGIRLTAVRLMIWKAVRQEFQGVFSLADLEESLPTVDRSTLFRTLTLLSEKHLLHNVDDGSGTQKYCVCHHDDTRHCLGHVHLTCRICHTTTCLSDVTIPQVPLPEGFVPEETEYVVKGICSRCALRKAYRE